MTDGRTILVSENRLFRDGIRQMLERSNITVVGECRGLDDLLAAVGTDAEPELVIFHLASDQHSESPLAAIRDLHDHFSQAKLVVLADQCTRAILPALLHADVSAILFTQISRELLESSLDLVLNDHRLFPADIMPALTADPAEQSPPAAIEADIDALPQPANAPPLDPGQTPPLSRREYQVVQCLAIGLSNKTIARRLHITEGTVKVHVKGLLRKLRATNRTQLAIWALRQTQAANANADAADDTFPESRRAV